VGDNKDGENVANMAQMLFIERIMKSQNCKEYKISIMRCKKSQIRIYNNDKKAKLQ
jgi:hypothetical protein